jgi:hypothetical protein
LNLCCRDRQPIDAKTIQRLAIPFAHLNKQLGKENDQHTNQHLIPSEQTNQTVEPQRPLDKKRQRMLSDDCSLLEAGNHRYRECVDHITSFQ